MWTCTPPPYTAGPGTQALGYRGGASPHFLGLGEGGDNTPAHTPAEYYLALMRPRRPPAPSANIWALRAVSPERGAQDDWAVLNVSSMTSESVNTIARLTNDTLMSSFFPGRELVCYSLSINDLECRRTRF